MLVAFSTGSSTTLPQNSDCPLRPQYHPGFEIKHMLDGIHRISCVQTNALADPFSENISRQGLILDYNKKYKNGPMQ
jgi:hypothetical protein